MTDDPLQPAAGPGEAAVRTLRFDGGWFTVVDRRLVGDPTPDPWHAIARGRRTARRLGRPHLIDLPGETVLEDVSHVESTSPAPWSSPPGDRHALQRARSAGERAERARRRLAELRASAAATTQTADAALVAARHAHLEAAAARARSAEVFEQSALAHEAAADVHDRLAQLGAEPEHHRARAAHHRRAAEFDWRMSRRDQRTGADRTEGSS